MDGPTLRRAALLADGWRFPGDRSRRWHRSHPTARAEGRCQGRCHPAFDSDRRLRARGNPARDPGLLRRPSSALPPDSQRGPRKLRESRRALPQDHRRPSGRPGSLDRSQPPDRRIARPLENRRRPGATGSRPSPRQKPRSRQVIPPGCDVVARFCIARESPARSCGESMDCSRPIGGGQRWRESARPGVRRGGPARTRCGRSQALRGLPRRSFSRTTPNSR